MISSTDSFSCRVCYTEGHMHCLDSLVSKQGTCYSTDNENLLDQYAEDHQFCTRHLDEDIYK